MTTPSVRFVMEQARATEEAAIKALSCQEAAVTSAVWSIKRDAYVRDRFGYTKPHLYLAQYPSGKSYWRVCGSWNMVLNQEAHLACCELNRGSE